MWVCSGRQRINRVQRPSKQSGAAMLPNLSRLAIIDRQAAKLAAQWHGANGDDDLLPMNVLPTTDRVPNAFLEALGDDADCAICLESLTNRTAENGEWLGPAVRVCRSRTVEGSVARDGGHVFHYGCHMRNLRASLTGLPFQYQLLCPMCRFPTEIPVGDNLFTDAIVPIPPVPFDIELIPQAVRHARRARPNVRVEIDNEGTIVQYRNRPRQLVRETRTNGDVTIHTPLGAASRALRTDQSFESVVELVEKFKNAPSLTVETLKTPECSYILIGENHYVASGEKHALADAIRQLVTDGHIDLFIEARSDSAGANAADSLLLAIGVSYERCPDPDGLSESLVLKLEDLVPDRAKFFASRPEELEASMMVDPEALMRILEIAGTCLDLRQSRAIEAISATASIAEHALGSALAMAERLVREGKINTVLLPIIASHLEDIMTVLSKAISKQISCPLLYSLRDNVLPSEFIEVVTHCIFAPHVVSDAVLATKLMRRASRSKPVLIVGGSAHTMFLSRLLKV